MPSSIAGRSLCLFVYLLVLDGAALFFFTRGFLLTRTEVPLFSSCSDITECSACSKRSPFFGVSTDILPETANSGYAEDDVGKDLLIEQRDDQCWTRPAVKKVVIIIIDALRFDFLAHSRNFDREKKPWMDRLRVLQRQTEQSNSSARIFKLLADPPTTTQQRLKGLTTGGLPTFIDIGQSFGAPAIVEDNLLVQLQRTGKRVVMMGDDTWMHLFPTAFAEAYPFPSFNVKDLHTVDNGVIQELFPALHRDNWDVLIAHFLGVDHVGHIFGVESPLMVDKLDQYNTVIEDVIELLSNNSQPGGLFEDSLLLVLGDHGQTLNGDHGGGTPEEVETALFALSTDHFPSSILPNVYPSPCDLEDPVVGCINTFSQLDFSATLAALIGVPFPFGSIGQVNADLFALGAGSSINLPETSHGNESLLSTLKLMDLYRGVLCINSWQVKRYFEAYAKLALSGFKTRDLAWIEHLYANTQKIPDQYQDLDSLLRFTVDVETRGPTILGAVAALRRQIEAHKEYLAAAASLARSKWTEFGMEWMALGLLLLLGSVIIRAIAIYHLCRHGSKHGEKLFPLKLILFGILGSVCLTGIVILLHPLLTRTSAHWMLSYVNDNMGIVFLGLVIVTSAVVYITSSLTSSFERNVETSNDALEGHDDSKQSTNFQLNVRIIGTSTFVALQVFSVFSNSYIVAEGSVIHFLLASSGILFLRSAFQAKANLCQAFCFLILIWIMPRIQTFTSLKSSMHIEGMVSDSSSNLMFLNIILTCATILLPLAILSWLGNWKARSHPVLTPVMRGSTSSFFLIGLHWLVADLASTQLISIPDPLIEFNRLYVPRFIYAMTIFFTFNTVVWGKSWSRGLDRKHSDYRKLLVTVALALLSGSSGTIILLAGRKGPLLSLMVVLMVWAMLELQNTTTLFEQIEPKTKDLQTENSNIKTSYGGALDWSLIASQVFFCTGHTCSFDGLHFSAAFIGFDEFSLFGQGVLIITETFGASHVFPVIGLPLLVLGCFGPTPSDMQISDDTQAVVELTKGYLWFGFYRAVVMSATAASVCIHRRHLMVWGIFAPKYSFEGVGFLIVDLLVVLAMALFFSLKPRKLHTT